MRAHHSGRASGDGVAPRDRTESPTARRLSGPFGQARPTWALDRVGQRGRRNASRLSRPRRRLQGRHRQLLRGRTSADARGVPRRVVRTGRARAHGERVDPSCAPRRPRAARHVRGRPGVGGERAGGVRVGLVCTTPDARPQTRDTARTEGFDECLVAPIHVDPLVAAIARAAKKGQWPTPLA
jgi:hypothetical protein